MKVWSLTLILIAFLLPIAADGKTPERNPKRGVSSPKRLLPGDVATDPWSDAEIAAAKAECTETLSGTRLDFEPLPPMQKGLCGTPAPILVKSLGSDAKVEIDPPATVTCELAKALHDWIFDAVQSEAKALFGAPVVKLQATSYACRNRYHSPNPPVSEHALANALDLTEFVLASGDHVTVINNWPKRSLNAALSLRSTLPLTNVSTSPTGVSVKRESEFLRNVHEYACTTFGTVLGPAANRAHKDHFHLDMKQRRANLCQ
jgi:hypothetical protein